MNAFVFNADARLPTLRGCNKALRIAGWLLLLCLLLLCTPAEAGAFADGYNKIGQMENAMIQRVSRLVSDPSSNLRQAALRLYFVMGLALLIWKAAGWALRGFSLADMFYVSAQIAFVGFMMAALPVVVPAIFSAALFIGNALLSNIIGVASSDVTDAQLPVAMASMVQKYTFKPNCGSFQVCLASNPGGVLASIATSLALTLLGVAALIVDVWGFWGVTVAMACGMVFVPFVLYKRLAFLFDGWMRFFFGFLVYIIIARVNLALVTMALLSFLNVSVPAFMGGAAVRVVPPVGSVSDVIGMLLMATVGLFTLGATGTFARAMITGAGAGGVNFGAMAHNAAHFVASSASTAIRAGAAGVNAAANGGDGKAVGKAITGSLLETARKSNSAFDAGNRIGAAVRHGADVGWQRGVKIGADPSKPTGGGVPPTPQQKAQGAVGAVIGAASEAALTAAALAVGLKVKDPYKEKEALEQETQRAVEVGYRAAQALDSEKSKVTGPARQEVGAALARLNETLNTATTAAEVREASNAVREAMREAIANQPPKPDPAPDHQAPGPAEREPDPPQPPSRPMRGPASDPTTYIYDADAPPPRQEPSNEKSNEKSTRSGGPDSPRSRFSSGSASVTYDLDQQRGISNSDEQWSTQESGPVGANSQGSDPGSGGTTWTTIDVPHQSVNNPDTSSPDDPRRDDNSR